MTKIEKDWTIRRSCGWSSYKL